MRNQLLALFVCVCLILAGCGREDTTIVVQTGYGRTAGPRYSSSVNGTSVLSQLFKQRGCRVDVAKSITSRIKKYDQIVWFPNRFEPVSQEAIERLEQWLETADRQLIIVGRDYDSALDYWQAVVDQAKGQNRIKAKRKLAQAKADFYQRRSEYRESDECKWFQIEDVGFQKATRLGGGWASKVDSTKASVQLGQLLKAKRQHSEIINNMTTTTRYRLEHLLTADDQPVVTRIRSRDFESGNILLVSNASFLTNYALVNQENRKLAKQLVYDKANIGKTLFLETGPNAASVRNTDEVEQSPWAWIAEPPLNFMVPHFLFWGVVFCFTIFPIFGRPRRWNSKSEETTFRSHVKAIGRLMTGDSSEQFAKNQVEQYLRRSRNEDIKKN